MSEKLKPCPFCGGKAAEPDESNSTWCADECFKGYVHVDTWNRRHQDQSNQSEFERMLSK